MDFANLVKINLSGVCFSCLNSNRKMYFCDRVNKCINMIADIYIPKGVIVKVCWECMAYIDNVFRFKGTVERSYHILTDYYMKENTFDRLENLSVNSHQRLQCRSCEPVDFPPQQEWPVKDDIKVEKYENIGSNLSLECAALERSTIKEAEHTNVSILETNEMALKHYEVPLVLEDSLQRETLNPLINIRDSEIDKTEKSLNARKLYRCGYCEREFPYRSRLFKHMRIHTGEKPFSCELCSFKSTESGNLKIHMRTHTGEKPFSCEVCSYQCRVGARLKQHMLTHTGAYPYNCEMCPYKSIESTALKRHMRTHTGEKPFSCELCSYKSIIKGNLTKHMRIHTGEKPFVCEFCSFKCNESGHLKKHLRTHTGEKPYSCNICSFRFSASESLKSHMQTHTDEKQFGCELCSYRSRRKRGLKTHMRTHTDQKGSKGA